MQNKSIRDLESATEQHQKEMQEFKTRTTDHINLIENEVIKLDQL